MQSALENRMGESNCRVRASQGGHMGGEGGSGLEKLKFQFILIRAVFEAM